MTDDPIVAAVRRTRDEHLARFNYDLDAIYRDLKEREKSSGRKYIRLPARPFNLNRNSMPAGTE